ncbi:MAG: tetratricopeptide repeat protein [Crocinitomicaceae bacterium]|jgi:TolA-binding protein|nr:tetratricopeptide repeat protein [Crocinitomicaceae bacterium]MDP4760137.1 tetratricopeptide repeat protein [Crocinitomicaceae bacterium]
MIENLSLDELKANFNNNKKFKFGTYIVGGLLAALLLFFVYRQLIWVPANEKSNDGWWVAMNYISKDSTDQAIKVLVPFVKNNDGKTGGEIGQYLLATQYMKKGEFRKALKNLEGVSIDDSYIRVFSIGLQGDCYSDMKKYDKALEIYLQAADAQENELTAPMYLFKAGLVAEKLKKKKDAEAYYTRIRDDYPSYASQNRIEIDKYIARVSTK